jgi:hypothetical protein
MPTESTYGRLNSLTTEGVASCEEYAKSRRILPIPAMNRFLQERPGQPPIGRPILAAVLQEAGPVPGTRPMTLARRTNPMERWTATTRWRSRQPTNRIPWNWARPMQEFQAVLSVARLPNAGAWVAKSSIRFMSRLRTVATAPLAANRARGAGRGVEAGQNRRVVRVPPIGYFQPDAQGRRTSRHDMSGGLYARRTPRHQSRNFGSDSIRSHDGDEPRRSLR